ncbi:MAG: DUF3179 domain-containing protein [candidate division Zixibacteria bacterium]|nr:DUF3179 domain-containing protein [candidate division Zixibacteria bacterium]
MYAADVDSERHTFQASGSLWQDALVMQDLESKSLWSQVSGKCIMGDKLGQELELFPSMMTTYAEFKQLFPDGVLLAKPEKGEQGAPYEKYFSNPDKLGMFGRANDFERLKGKDIIYGLRLAKGEVAISKAYLHDKGFAFVADSKSSIAVTFDSKSGTVAAYLIPHSNNIQAADFLISDNRLTFSVNDKTWNMKTGKSASGHGDLSLAPILSSYWFAWVSFFPETELIK